MEKKIETTAKTETTKVEEAKLVEVPTQYAPAYQLEDGKVVDERELLLVIYQDLQKVKKSVA